MIDKLLLILLLATINAVVADDSEVGISENSIVQTKSIKTAPNNDEDSDRDADKPKYEALITDAEIFLNSLEITDLEKKQTAQNAIPIMSGKGGKVQMNTCKLILKDPLITNVRAFINSLNIADEDLRSKTKELLLLNHEKHRTINTFYYILIKLNGTMGKYEDLRDFFDYRGRNNRALDRQNGKLLSLFPEQDKTDDAREYILTLLDEDMGEYQRDKIIEVIFNISEADRMIVINLAKSLFVKKMDGYRKSQLIYGVHELYKTKHDKIIPFMVTQLNRGTSSYYKSQLLELLLLLNLSADDQVESKVKIVIGFLNSMGECCLFSAIETIANIAKNDRLAVITKCKIDDHMYPHEVSNAIKIAHINFQQKQYLKQCSLQ